MAVLTTALTRLRADFDTAFPNRDKATDGWIGDLAHQGGASGHNPDESGRAEYRDADSKDEVRAIDVDKDLRGGRTMLQVIGAVLATARDRDRLKYIIFNGVIWSRSTGWQPHRYTGSNLHGKHAHFSGDPQHDEDDAPYTSILGTGDDMAEMVGSEALGAYLMRIERALWWPIPGIAAALTESKAREVALQASVASQQTTIDSLVTLLQAGGGDPDVAPLVAQITTLTEQVAALARREQELLGEVRAARAAAEANLSEAERAELAESP